MTKQELWAIQATTSKGKALCWNYKGGKALYFTLTKKAPVPALFSTRQDAIQAIKKSEKAKENKCKVLFKNTIECTKAFPVKINISVLN